MYQDTYYVCKSTATPADTLVAHGLAALLTQLGRQAVGAGLQVSVHDEGPYYAVKLNMPVTDAWLEYEVTGLPFLAAGKQAQVVPTGVTFYDYALQREKRAAYFELRKQIRANKELAQDMQVQARLKEMMPTPSHELFAKINQMSAIIAYNGVVKQWQNNQAARKEQLKLLLMLFSEPINPLFAIVERWKKQAQSKKLVGKPMISASQVVNPGMGKGANHSKANKLKIGQQSSFWILEYLKFWGARLAMVPRIVSGSKDRKSYVLEPYNLTTRTANPLFEQFQRVMWPSTHIKMDILAVLRWMRVFLQGRMSGGERVARLRGQQPSDFVRGLWVVSYKDLGKAHGVINVSLLRLPCWMRNVEDEQDTLRYLELVEEQRHVVESLDEKKSNAYDLLRVYRDFMSGANIHAFFRFCAGYSSQLLKMMNERRSQHVHPPQFSTRNLEELFMAHEQADCFGLIINDAGFQSVAKAIRQSTVNAQYQQAKQKRVYEVRYGLGARLWQKSRYRDELVQELTRFMFQYNQENARLAERINSRLQSSTSKTEKKQLVKPFRHDISTSDIQSLMNLIDNPKNRPETIAGLLVSYGYAKES